MANMYQAPNEYATEQADIERRRKYAEALQAQGMQPLGPTESVGGWAIQKSPLEGLAKALQGYTARKGIEDADARQKALGERYSAERGAALANALKLGAGAPAQPELPANEMDYNGTPAAPAMLGNRQAMIAALAGSKFPDLQAAGMAQQMKDITPVNLGPGHVYGVPGQAPIMTAPFKPDAPIKPEAPHTRSIQRGDQKVFQEFDPATRTWADIPGATGPAFSKQVAPVVIDGGRKEKAPVGYRFSSDGETLEPIPGGPKDPGAVKLPTQALKLQQAEVDAIGTSAGIKADLGKVIEQLSETVDPKTGAKKPPALQLGLVNNLVGTARNYVGKSDENSRNLGSFKATLEKLRNDSLRLNKGVQTEGDAIRAWNEILANPNDQEFVKKRLAEVQEINDRAIDLRKMNIDNIRRNYGAPPLDTSGQEGVRPAIGNPPDAPRGRAAPASDMPPPGAVRRIP